MTFLNLLNMIGRGIEFTPSFGLTQLLYASASAAEVDQPKSALAPVDPSWVIVKNLKNDHRNGLWESDSSYFYKLNINDGLNDSQFEILIAALSEIPEFDHIEVFSDTISALAWQKFGLILGTNKTWRSITINGGRNFGKTELNALAEGLKSNSTLLSLKIKLKSINDDLDNQALEEALGRNTTLSNVKIKLPGDDTKEVMDINRNLGRFTIRNDKAKGEKLKVYIDQIAQFMRDDSQDPTILQEASAGIGGILGIPGNFVEKSILDIMNQKDPDTIDRRGTQYDPYIWHRYELANIILEGIRESSFVDGRKVRKEVDKYFEVSDYLKSLFRREQQRQDTAFYTFFNKRRES